MKNIPKKQSTVLDTFKKAITAKSQWHDKDEFLDVIYWFKQIIGVILGLLWGFIPLKGFLGLVLFAGISLLFIYLYSSVFQQIDEDEFGGYGDIFKEGLLSAFASFVVVWILIYDMLYTFSS